MPGYIGQPGERRGAATSDLGRPGWPPRYVAAAVTATALLGTATWLSTLLQPSPAAHDIALFAHLGFLVLGFGAVLVVDYLFALWLLGRTSLTEAITNASRLHLLVWSGLVGMAISGMLLGPDLSSRTTVLKLALVATLTLNGVQATLLSRRMSSLTSLPPTRMLLKGGLVSLISQACWWGAAIIGFLNANT